MRKDVVLYHIFINRISSFQQQ